MAITVSITAGIGTIMAASDAGPLRHPLVAAAVTTAGLAIIVAAGPRLAAEIAALPARSVLWDSYTQKDVPVTALLDAAAALDTAGRIERGAVTEGERGYLLLQAANKAPAADRKALLAASETATRNSLAASPGNPSQWLRLAHLRDIQGDVGGTIMAWRLSVLTGSFEPVIMESRLRMGVRLMPWMDTDTAGLLPRQVRNTLQTAPGLIVELADQPDTAALVHSAMEKVTEQERLYYTRFHGGPPPNLP